MLPDQEASSKKSYEENPYNRQLHFYAPGKERERETYPFLYNLHLQASTAAHVNNHHGFYNTLRLSYTMELLLYQTLRAAQFLHDRESITSARKCGGKLRIKLIRYRGTHTEILQFIIPCIPRQIFKETGEGIVSASRNPSRQCNRIDTDGPAVCCHICKFHLVSRSSSTAKVQREPHHVTE